MGFMYLIATQYLPLLVIERGNELEIINLGIHSRALIFPRNKHAR